MNLSILHISDLHRDPDNPIRNQVLLDSLERDRDRYSRDELPRIPPPDLVIVSGDIIQGVKHNAPDAEAKLHRQYEEALEFLNQLSLHFVDGDKQRVLIVPGNHDVSDYHFRKSLERINIAPDRKKELVAELFSPGSHLRWSWSDFELYKITDFEMYAFRFAPFAEFYRTFYEGLRTYSTDSSAQLDIFDLPAFGLTVAGFSSCHNNDLFGRQGAIHPACISDAGTQLRDPSYQDRLRIAVWHHGTEGPPIQSDYMDTDIVQNLIDRGFSLGFHGHQHRPQFLDTRFRHGPKRRITVISAGTLCGGAAFRFGRAYNLVELDIEQRTGRFHLREMQNDNLESPIWGPRPLPPSAASYIDFDLDPLPEPVITSDRNTRVLIRAQSFYDQKEYGKAAEILSPLSTSDQLARRLLLQCLAQLDDLPGIIAHFDLPASSAEAVSLMDALWSEQKRDRLRELLRTPRIAQSADPSVIEMRNKYVARLSK